MSLITDTEERERGMEGCLVVGKGLLAGAHGLRECSIDERQRNADDGTVRYKPCRSEAWRGGGGRVEGFVAPLRRRVPPSPRQISYPDRYDHSVFTIYRSAHHRLMHHHQESIPGVCPTALNSNHPLVRLRQAAHQSVLLPESYARRPRVNLRPNSIPRVAS